MKHHTCTQSSGGGGEWLYELNRNTSAQLSIRGIDSTDTMLSQKVSQVCLFTFPVVAYLCPDSETNRFML